MHTHQKITLDINQNASFVYINAKQGDKSTRYVDAIITCDGVQYKPPVGSMAYFRCEKSDGTGCSYPATINTDGSVTAELTNKALSAPGDVVADISIEGMYGEVLSTASFTIRVEEIPLGDKIESSNEYVRLIALTNRANEIVSELENATFRTFQGYIQATTDGENWVDLVEINTLVGSQGPAGKSAYAYAQDGGYTGTEEEFAEKLAQGTIGATPAFYVTVQPNNVGSGYKADKTIDEIDEAYKSGKPVFCNFSSDSVGRGTLLLMTWPTTPVIVYSFRGVVDLKEVTVNITKSHVGAIIDDLAIKDDTSAFYVGVQFDGESGGYVADKTVEEIGAAYQEGEPVFCKFIGETSFRMTLLLMTANDYMCSFSGADSVRSVTVNITQTGVGATIKEIPTKTSQLENDSGFITDEDIPEVPTELPNPNALTFTGAVSGSYDGSSAQTINIPTIAGEPGADGKDGADGYTPVKGTDYWTDADQESIVQQVIAALGTPVFGRVDADNNIILTGELADGTYTLKYEDADGNVTEIGTIEVGGAAYTNLADPTSEDWAVDKRLNSSAVLADAAGCRTTNYFPCVKDDVIRVKGLDIRYTNSELSQNARAWFFNADGHSCVGSYPASDPKFVFDGTDMFTITLDGLTNISGGSEEEIVRGRFSGMLFDGYTDEDVIITVNQEIE